MRKPVIYLLAIAFIFTFFTISSYAATTDSSKIIVDGKPPITQYAIDCHIKILEYVLQTRLTVGQKNAFLRAIKRECKKMDEQSRKDFLEVVDLVDSMKDFDARQQEIVRKVLEQDFLESAKDTKNDPAARLFLKLYNTSNKPIFEKIKNFSNQSFKAFAEYLAFVQNPDSPERISKKERHILKHILKKNYNKLNNEAKQTLEDFQFTWYMIRAAWQFADERKKIEWRKTFKRCKVKLGKELTFKSIEKALSTNTFGQLLDEAVKMKISSREWSPVSKFRVW